MDPMFLIIIIIMIILIIITIGNLVFTDFIAFGSLSPLSCAYRHTKGGTSVCIWLSPQTIIHQYISDAMQP